MTSPSSAGDPQLQFDTAVAALGLSDAGAACTRCHSPIPVEYFEANGLVVCASCLDAITVHTETPRGWGTFLRAALFGAIAAVAGAVLYYAVIAITDFEIGIVAIAIGYMVGYAIRRAARERGGRRFQVLAIALTYLAVALAYTPLVVGSALDKEESDTTATLATPTADADVVVSAKPRSSEEVAANDANAEPVSTAGVVGGLALLIGFIAALPILSVVTSFPGGLISAAIIAFGMQQAWRMTGRPPLIVNGPYRIGSAAAVRGQ